MYLNRKANTFYIYTSLFVVAGWSWFLWSFLHGNDSSVTICLFKNVTGYPCPACGSTTSVGLIVKGAFAEALWMNPLGYLVGAGLLLLPIWIFIDLMTERRTMYHSLHAFDRKVKQQRWALVLIILPLLLNWGWNLIKM